MSIDATVVGISRNKSGEVRLTIEQPDKSRCAGRSTLCVADPIPTNIAILLGKPIWGGSDTLMCGEVKIGKRLGYSMVKLDYDSLIKVASGPILRDEMSQRELMKYDA